MNDVRVLGCIVISACLLTAAYALFFDYRPDQPASPCEEPETARPAAKPKTKSRKKPSTKRTKKGTK